jgi:hypothetical protein
MECNKKMKQFIPQFNKHKRSLNYEIYLFGFGTGSFAGSNTASIRITIFHEKSKRKTKGQNSWLHPDIVGVRFPFNDYIDETRQLMNTMSVKICKLFSFEIKIELNFSTLREYYFQAVSNSSWANEGYLAALTYDQDPEFKDEMRRLNNAFGIGFIQLSTEDYLQSEIILPARYNESLDWNTIDRLSEENEDFRNFADSIVGNMQRGKLDIDKHFDKTFNNPDELVAYIKDKKNKPYPS